MDVCGIQVTEADVAWLRERSAAGDAPSRSGLAREWCDRKGLRDGRGKRREVTARVALRRLECAGAVSLPARRKEIPQGRRWKRSASVQGVYTGKAKDLGELGEVEIVPVTRRQRVEHAQWRGLLRQSHYLGDGPLCGAQVRYLVRSEKGLLGALAFSASAWRLAARDRWIGWSEAGRRRNLQQVVANSRFLLVPRVPNLASHVLSQVLARLASDWEERYGYRPVLVETFVDPRRFMGTCYRAANWQHLGSTAGRGRQDRKREGTGEAKEVYVHPLDPAWRETLCREPVTRRSAEGDWAEEELGEARLSDARLNQRLLTIARDFMARPTANIPQACGARARTKAVYRFCAHERVTMEAILASHYETTLRRVAQEKVVLAIQDTTSLNYTTHRSTEGLGPIGSFGAQATLGLEVHSTFMVNRAGTPLGLLDVQCWARETGEAGAEPRPKSRSIEDKESRKWLVGYEATARAQRRLDGTKIVNVGDREADVFDLFVRSRRSAEEPYLLVRAAQPRKIQSTDSQAPYIWDYVRSLPCPGRLPLSVPRSGARPRRETTLAVRWAEVQVRPPKDSGHKAVQLWAIAAQEESPPAQGEPIEWLLLTTWPVASVEDAAEKIAWYALRWQIEVYHRTLKSGCRIENRQLGSAHSLKACLAVDLVVAWRVFHLAKLGRELPEAPCTIFFEDAEWKALVCFLKKTPHPPSEAPTLRKAIHMVASLGGFLGRQSDGDPGTQTVWLGLQRLDDIAAVFRIFTESSLDSS